MVSSEPENTLVLMKNVPLKTVTNVSQDITIFARPVLLDSIEPEDSNVKNHHQPQNVMFKTVMYVYSETLRNAKNVMMIPSLPQTEMEK